MVCFTAGLGHKESGLGNVQSQQLEGGYMIAPTHGIAVRPKLLVLVAIFAATLLKCQSKCSGRNCRISRVS